MAAAKERALADILPHATAVLEQGIADGLHLGAIVHVVHEDKVVADGAIGRARPGVAMTPEQLIIWWSMTKPSVAVSIAKLWEAGQLGLNDPVAKYLPEFAANGKEAVTIRHCLTHTGGFREGDKVVSRSPKDQRRLLGTHTTNGPHAVVLKAPTESVGLSDVDALAEIEAVDARGVLHDRKPELGCFDRNRSDTRQATRGREFPLRAGSH